MNFFPSNHIIKVASTFPWWVLQYTLQLVTVNVKSYFSEFVTNYCNELRFRENNGNNNKLLLLYKVSFSTLLDGKWNIYYIRSILCYLNMSQRFVEFLCRFPCGFGNLFHLGFWTDYPFDCHVDVHVDDSRNRNVNSTYLFLSWYSLIGCEMR